MVNGQDAGRRGVEKIVEQIHKMDAVGEHHAAVVARSLESAEMSAQDVDPPKFARLNGVANPLRGRIEAEDVADLQDAFFLSANSASCLDSSGARVSGFSTKTSLPASKNSRQVENEIAPA